MFRGPNSKQPKKEDTHVFRCPSCKKIIASTNGRDYSFNGSCTIFSNSPPNDPHSNRWLKCSKDNQFCITEKIGIDATRNDINLLITILVNIVDNPSNATYRSLNFEKVYNKCENKEWCINVLYDAGFSLSANDERLLFGLCTLTQLCDVLHLLDTNSNALPLISVHEHDPNKERLMKKVHYTRCVIEVKRTFKKTVSSANQLIDVGKLWRNMKLTEETTDNFTRCHHHNTGNQENNTSHSTSSVSEEEKKDPQKDDSNRNNDNDANHHSNDNNNNNNNHNEKGSSTNCDNNCNVYWHLSYIKELEDENARLRLLLATNGIQMDSDTTENELKLDSEISGDYNSSNESKELEPLLVQKDDNLPNDAVHIAISKQLTQLEITKKIRETFSNVVEYMNQFILFHREDAIQAYSHQETMIQVRDYDFHCKTTEESMYVICKQSLWDLSWRMRHKLFTASEIEHTFGVSVRNNLPRALFQKTVSLEIQHAQKQIKSILMNKKQRNRIITSKNTPWNHSDKIPVYNKNSQYGITLRLTKQQFVNKVKRFADEKKDDIHLIPIIRCSEYEYNVEIAWIVEMDRNRNIAIALQLDGSKKLKVKGIYLDIHDVHKLAHWKCDDCCLSSFKCDIDCLAIGASQEKRMYQSKLDTQIHEYNQLKMQLDETLDEYNLLKEQYDKQIDGYESLRKTDDAVIEEMIAACARLQRDLASTQLFVVSLLQNQIQINQQQNQCQGIMNFLHQHQQQLQTYHNQLISNQVSNTNNNNDNQQQ